MKVTEWIRLGEQLRHVAPLFFTTMLAWLEEDRRDRWVDDLAPEIENSEKLFFILTRALASYRQKLWSKKQGVLTHGSAEPATTSESSSTTDTG